MNIIVESTKINESSSRTSEAEGNVNDTNSQRQREAQTQHEVREKRKIDLESEMISTDRQSSQCQYESDNIAKKAKLETSELLAQKIQTAFDPAVIRKKKVALLISYCGAGYYGMQRNPDVKTIEDDLINALYLAGAIKEDVKDDLAKMSFQRCARTDKGVSAACQVVSLKMVPEKEIVEEINKQLPPIIRVFGLKRVTKGFDCKINCSGRTYEYLLPTFVFAPMEMEATPCYRVKDHIMDEVNEICSRYHGTHNFHNFTSGRLSTDPSSKRYLVSFKAGQPFHRKGYEFVALSVTGQSFMLHQIRKMIGLCIAIVKGLCSIDVIDKAWESSKVDIPKAPGLGLVLDRVHFTGYNKRYGSDGIHEPISWNEYEEQIHKFKENYIWSTIIDTEIAQHSMMKWLSTLGNHTYDDERMISERMLLPGEINHAKFNSFKDSDDESLDKDTENCQGVIEGNIQQQEVKIDSKSGNLEFEKPGVNERGTEFTDNGLILGNEQGCRTFQDTTNMNASDHTLIGNDNLVSQLNNGENAQTKSNSNLIQSVEVLDEECNRNDVATNS